MTYSAPRMTNLQGRVAGAQATGRDGRQRDDFRRGCASKKAARSLGEGQPVRTAVAPAEPLRQPPSGRPFAAAWLIAGWRLKPAN